MSNTLSSRDLKLCELPYITIIYDLSLFATNVKFYDRDFGFLITVFSVFIRIFGT